MLIIIFPTANLEDVYKTPSIQTKNSLINFCHPRFWASGYSGGCYRNDQAMRRAFGRPRGGSVDGLSQCEARFFFCARPAWPAILSGFGTSKMRSKPTDIWRFNKSNIGFKHVETTKNCRLNTTIFRNVATSWLNTHQNWWQTLRKPWYEVPRSGFGTS
jgi:hypothetical protein